MYWGYYRWGIGFGLIMVIAFWVLFILGIVLFIRFVFKSGKHIDSADSALDILRKRYARGEIDREEFRKIKDDITKN
jgi:putative membrane protein